MGRSDGEDDDKASVITAQKMTECVANNAVSETTAAAPDRVVDDKTAEWLACCKGLDQ